MRKALAIPFPLSITSSGWALRALIAGEILAGLLLAAGGQIPSAAVRALQLFLRF